VRLLELGEIELREVHELARAMIRRWAVQVWSRGAKGEVESAILVTA
jgi:hypothetical protein